MPVKLKQVHFAQAPEAFYTAFITSRNHSAHLRALCMQYDNIISEPFPCRSLVYKLYNQITASQKQHRVLKDQLALVEDEIGYYEDPDRMTWLTKPDRRRYEYEPESLAQTWEKFREDAEKMSAMALSAAQAQGPLQYSSDEDSDSERDRKSQSSSQTSVSTPPSSPPSPPPSPPIKKVRFGHLPSYRRRGIMRIATKEEVEAEFEAANAKPVKTSEQCENRRKRKREDKEDPEIEVLRKRLKKLHLWNWPKVYFETV